MFPDVHWQQVQVNVYGYVITCFRYQQGSTALDRFQSFTFLNRVKNKHSNETGSEFISYLFSSRFQKVHVVMRTNHLTGKQIKLRSWISRDVMMLESRD